MGPAPFIPPDTREFILPTNRLRDRVMHETGIVQSIIDILEQQAAMYHAKKIVRVNLEFGVLTAVMPDAIRFAFDILSKGTIAENAVLDIKMIPIKILCPECNAEHTLDAYQPLCPVCESPAVLIVEGRDEMRIASMEVDDGEG